jgi:hypothetical protein
LVRWVLLVTRGRVGLGAIEDAYTGSDLLAALIVEEVISLAEDVVPSVFEPCSLEIPVAPIISWLGVDMNPYLGARRDEGVGADAGDGA